MKTIESPITGRRYFHKRKKSAPSVDVLSVDAEQQTVTYKYNPVFKPSRGRRISFSLTLPSGRENTISWADFWSVYRTTML